MSRVAQLDGVSLDLQLTRALQSDLGFPCPQIVVEILVFLLGSRRWHQGSVATYGSVLTGVGYQCSRWRLFAVTVVLRHLLHRFERTNLVYELLDLIHLLQFLTSGTGGPSLLHRLFRVPAVFQPGFSYSDTTSGSSASEVQMLWNASIEMIAGLSLFKNGFVSVTSTNAAAVAAAKAIAGGSSSVGAPGEKFSQKNTLCPVCGEVATNAFTITCCNTRYCYTCALEVEQSHCLVCNTKNPKFFC
ncbi:ubiquitin-protein ligase peroxin 2 [Kluyveromyces lactis]|uniref:KLLA0D00418p n=1 Tax=Kluyveromyces lactis (strain ATCC 8585 / CBS 2359 / DSM 70799 / NBRC 1267 / NRRL Y-1140 / WM37) TaxID=284590 RepID=Q6CSJ9_KLULA|nr:uncharacterized protein KLLA0_D00418g [Kluyveromyces lactis]CAH00186.1 KLLA0D00418p [Kluyveromyces lactis]|eukprot:XP_453090.1 uncharacterized protein KLLA0_D00418g [Kluyveromyces lactis]